MYIYNYIQNGKKFISSAKIIKRNSLDKGIIVWDFNTGARISNQIYLEGYTCTSLAIHPKLPQFIAQSKGNYIALFSTNSPYKMNQRKRYEGHSLGGNKITCSYSPDGSLVLSGSSQGSIFFYNAGGSGIRKVLKGHNNACIDVKYHPLLRSTVASCGKDGIINIYE